MTIYELLKKDHKEVKKIFKMAKKSLPDDPEEALMHFYSIREELVSHAKAEEISFYEPLRKISADYNAEQVSLEGKQEHHVIALIIQEMSRMEVLDPEWEAKLKVLSEIVEHHIKEEESIVFKKARSVFTLQQAKEIAQEMKSLKEEFREKIDQILQNDADAFNSDSKNIINSHQFSG